MLSKIEFKRRFIARMEDLTGKDDDSEYFNDEAEAAYEMYEEDPDDMTPEEHAEEEIAEWGR